MNADGHTTSCLLSVAGEYKENTHSFAHVPTPVGLCGMASETHHLKLIVGIDYGTTYSGKPQRNHGELYSGSQL